MSDNKISSGTVVYLKSGGPALTFLGGGASAGGYPCMYYKKATDSFEKVLIPYEALTLVKPKD